MTTLKRITFSIIYLSKLAIISTNNPPGNLTDTNVCKLSHLGTEYVGHVSKTESFVRCQAWNKNSPHEMMDEVVNENFPESSVDLAKNYCRNPNRDAKGPWCYTLNEDLINETCAIRLCSFSECRVTGPGMEYMGEHAKTVSDRKCLKWNKDRKKVEHDGHLIKIDKYEKIFFPDGDLVKAAKKCRNPDGDPGGPWCFVENEEKDTVEKDHCDIPFCDEPLCVVYTKNYSTYFHFTDFNDTLDGLNFGVKLWSSDAYLDAEARLVLSVVALPIGKNEMEDFGTSIEIFLSNKYSALTVNNKDQVEYEATKGILRSDRYTFFSLTCHRGFITLYKMGNTKPIFIAEYRTKRNLMGFEINKFHYYAAQGTDILWTFPFCLDDYECDVHTTTGHLFQQFWPLRESSVGKELSLHVRAFHSAKILLTPTPLTDHPSVLVHFKAHDGYTRVVLKEHAQAPSLTLKEAMLTDALDYWNWQEYSLSFFGDTLQIHWTRNVGGAHLVMELRNEAFRKVKWFSVCSDNSIAHWTFFCRPPPGSRPPPAFLPECSMDDEEAGYVGTQDVTKDGFPCLPWSAKRSVPGFEKEFFVGNSSLAELSYCRDPGKEKKGTYCYVISMLPDKVILKKRCHIRKCKSQECRMAGTGNDYTGTMNITRSRRYCEPWFAPYTLHFHPVDHMNASRFPDRTIQDAGNFCRNPSRNPIGSWCYTIDPNVPQESCLVEDCDKPEECIVILTGNNEGRKTYILPQWKEKGAHGGLFFALKQWNPENIEGLSLTITPVKGNDTDNIVLEIGADGNQKIKISYNGVLEKEKTMPHLISSGTWTDFWLQIRQEEIMLGYKGVPSPLFEWKTPDIARAFEPTYISFSTITNNYLGVYFKCEDECHTEFTYINNALKVFPVGIWKEGDDRHLYENFTLNLRGTGAVWITLYNVIHTGDYLLLEMNQNWQKIALHKFARHQPTILKIIYVEWPLFSDSYWTKYEISFNETDFKITVNGTSPFEYKSSINEPILIYYFSLGVDNGMVIWSANCPLLDIDGPPRDGAWSAWSGWTCSVPCGGGEGFKTRSCTNPRPNVKGKLCLGSPMATGTCNDFECGDLSPKTLDKVRENLRKTVYNYVVSEGERVRLRNNVEIMRKIREESPKSRYEWSLNGMLLENEENHVDIRDDDVFLSNVIPLDSGVYLCVLYRTNNQRLVIGVASLAVVPDSYSITTRATMRLNLNCRAVVLGYVYSDLSMKLIVNKTTYKDYGIVTLAATNVYNFRHLKENYTGDWKCVIEQRDLGFTWTTNYIKILVKKAPNLYTNLLEDKLTKPLFGWLKTERNVLVALIVIVASAIVVVTLSLVLYFTLFTFKRRSYKRNRRL